MTLTDDHLPTIQEATHSRSTEKRKLEDLSSIAVSSIDNNTIFDGTFSLPEKPQRPNTVAAASSSSGNKISQDIAQYLETIYAQHSVPPEWILSTLQKHLDIDIKV